MSLSNSYDMVAAKQALLLSVIKSFNTQMFTLKKVAIVSLKTFQKFLKLLRRLQKFETELHEALSATCKQKKLSKLKLLVK